jgi:SSS family solute:Na+ symporter
MSGGCRIVLLGGKREMEVFMLVMIIVILYEVISIGGVSLYLYRKEKSAAVTGGDNFIAAGRSLPASVVGASIALAVLGSVHVFGIMEVSWGLGAVSVWFSIAHVVLICVICLATGRFVRRTRATTVPELIGKLYNRPIRIACVAVIAGQTFAILTMEVQALGIVFNALTQNGVTIFWGTVIGVILGVAYVFTAGMKEIGWVNMINTVIMYIGLIIALIFLSRNLMGGGGWNAVEDYFTSSDQSYMTNIFGTLGADGSLIGFGIATVIAVTFAQGISQMGLQSTMAAKSEKTVVKALWIAAPVNGLFGIFTMAIGIAAKASLESGNLVLPDEAIPAKQAGISLLLQTLPDWVVGWLLAAFLGAVLSTFAITTLGLGSIFVKDIYLKRNPGASEAVQKRVVRIIIVVAAVLAIAATTMMPAIINGANWAFAWLCPIFWISIYALFWKRSNLAAGITLAASWLCVVLWTFTPFSNVLSMPIPYLTLIISIVLGVVLTAILPGKPGYFKERRMAGKASA